VNAARKALFGTVTTVGLIFALELGARGLEVALTPAERSLPLPVAGCPEPCIEGTSATPRPPRSWQRGGVPMERSESPTAWHLRANTQLLQGGVVCHTNSLGLRGGEVASKDDGRARLMTLGDSSIFGFGVEDDDVFSAIAAAELSVRWGRTVDTVVGATPGHSSSQSLTVLESLGSRLEPDVVVIGNMWSDLYQAEEHPEDAPVRSPSALYRVTVDFLGPHLKPRTVGWLDADQSLGIPGPGRTARASLQEYRANLESMVAQTTALGAQPVLLMLPAPVDLDPAGVPDWIGDYRHVMRLVAHQKDAILVDGPAVFTENGATLADFFDQVHPAGTGHRILGEALAGALSDSAP